MFFAFIDDVSFIAKLSLFGQFDLRHFSIIYALTDIFTY